MMVLPLVFITVVSRFPTGLILYWMTTNLWTVGQGLDHPAARAEAAGAERSRASSGPKRSSRTPAKAEEAKDNGAPAAETPKPRRRPRRVKRKKGGARR